MPLNTRQRDALVWFWRRSPDALSTYNLADHLAGGFIQGRHPGGAAKLIKKLVEAGYVEPIGYDSYKVTVAGKNEAKRIRQARVQANRPLISGEHPPEWATTHLS